ncbi:MAG: tRNA (guanosine(37)-N1)-methyltransferase TrmD [Planktomarina sp.]|nr:tRNA (guanosine(37)-N1)-methyltransferase TrmD [Planktomarina sp.]
MSEPDRSHGRKSIRASQKPRALDGETPDLAGVWRADVITLFPDVFPGVLGASLTGKGLKEGKWQLHTHDLRPYGEGRHRNVDDTPAGGGPGMVMRADVLGRAISEVLRRRPPCPIIYMSPRGKPLTQARTEILANGPGPVILCGRFEGIDQRVIDHFKIEEVSIGDYVLSGGELAAQVMLDCAVRLIPGVLGNEISTEQESFSNGLLEHPQYTRPPVWEDRKIPAVLMSGHHGKVAEWQKQKSEALTQERRPDLWKAFSD